MSLTTVDGSLISSGAITLTTQVTGTLPVANGGTGVATAIDYGFKNRIINGAMVINQRNAGASVSIAAASTIYFSVDRFQTRMDTSTGSTIQQSSVAPAGFRNSDLITVGTGASPAAGAFNYFGQRVEGYNMADFDWGTANAQTVTLSFWIRSSLTGTFGISLRNAGADRSYVTSYVINSANTWEYKTITIAGETSGTWNTTNGVGTYLFWDIGQGATASTSTTNTWQAGNYSGLTGGVKLCQTSGATFYITGVQLEKGSTATSFDYRPYGTELALCQRYFSTSFPYGTAPVQNSGLYTWKVSMLSSGYGTFNQIQYPVPMRITGTTITGYNGGAANTLVRNVPAAVDITNLGTNTISTTAFTMQCYGGAGDGTGSPIGWNWSASAEL